MVPCGPVEEIRLKVGNDVVPFSLEGDEFSIKKDKDMTTQAQSHLSLVLDQHGTIVVSNVRVQYPSSPRYNRSWPTLDGSGMCAQKLQR